MQRKRERLKEEFKLEIPALGIALWGEINLFSPLCINRNVRLFSSSRPIMNSG